IDCDLCTGSRNCFESEYQSHCHSQSRRASNDRQHRFLHPIAHHSYPPRPQFVVIFYFPTAEPSIALPAGSINRQQMSALPPKADKREKARTLAVQNAMSDLDQNRAGRECAVRQLVLFFPQPLLSPLRSYATARCSARSSAASSPRATSETSSSSNWPNRDDGWSYSKVEPPFSFS